MQTLSIRDMRSALSSLDTLLDASGEILITRHGEPIARLLPIREKRSRPTHEDLHCLMQTLSIPSENIIREARDER
ncbi:hypothetical protein BH10PSE19_BH10PSE19_05870 [soil metagenome]